MVESVFLCRARTICRVEILKKYPLCSNHRVVSCKCTRRVSKRDINIPDQTEDLQTPDQNKPGINAWPSYDPPYSDPRYH